MTPKEFVDQMLERLDKQLSKSPVPIMSQEEFDADYVSGGI